MEVDKEDLKWLITVLLMVWQLIKMTPPKPKKSTKPRSKRQKKKSKR